MEWVGGNGHLKDSGGDLSDILGNKDGRGGLQSHISHPEIGGQDYLQISGPGEIVQSVKYLPTGAGGLEFHFQNVQVKK